MPRANVLGKRFSVETLLRSADTTTGKKRKRGAKKLDLPVEVVPGVDGVDGETTTRVKHGGEAVTYIPIGYARDGADKVAKSGLGVLPYVKHESLNAALKRAGIKFDVDAAKRPDEKSIQRAIDAGIVRRYVRNTAGDPEIVGIDVFMGPDWPFDNMTWKGSYIPIEIVTLFEAVPVASASTLKAFGKVLAKAYADDDEALLPEDREAMDALGVEDTEATG